METLSFKEIWNLMPKWTKAVFVLGIISMIILLGCGIFLGLALGTDIITEDLENLKPVPTKTIKIAKPSVWEQEKK